MIKLKFFFRQRYNYFGKYYIYYVDLHIKRKYTRKFDKLRPKYHATYEFLKSIIPTNRYITVSDFENIMLNNIDKFVTEVAVKQYHKYATIDDYINFLNDVLEVIRGINELPDESDFRRNENEKIIGSIENIIFWKNAIYKVLSRKATYVTAEHKVYVSKTTFSIFVFPAYDEVYAIKIPTNKLSNVQRIDIRISEKALDYVIEALLKYIKNKEPRYEKVIQVLRLIAPHVVLHLI